MQDPSFALSVAYAALLASLSYQDKPVGLYDQLAEEGATFPYVILGPWVAQSDNTKDSFGQKGEINLDVVTGFVGNATSRKASTEIANLITQRLKPTTTAEVLDLTNYGFRIILTVIENIQDISVETNTKSLRRKLITVSHTLCQI